MRTANQNDRLELKEISYLIVSRTILSVAFSADSEGIFLLKAASLGG